jgi:hypothetical protein
MNSGDDYILCCHTTRSILVAKRKGMFFFKCSNRHHLTSNWQKQLKWTQWVYWSELSSWQKWFFGPLKIYRLSRVKFVFRMVALFFLPAIRVYRYYTPDLWRVILGRKTLNLTAEYFYWVFFNLEKLCLRDIVIVTHGIYSEGGVPMDFYFLFFLPSQKELFDWPITNILDHGATIFPNIKA